MELVLGLVRTLVSEQTGKASTRAVQLPLAYDHAAQSPSTLTARSGTFSVK